jgi:hypothetical protein
MYISAIHRQTDTDTQTHTHRYTHRHRHRHTQTHRHTHTHTHTQCAWSNLTQVPLSHFLLHSSLSRAPPFPSGKANLCFGGGAWAAGQSRLFRTSNFLSGPCRMLSVKIAEGNLWINIPQWSWDHLRLSLALGSGKTDGLGRMTTCQMRQSLLCT